MHRTLMRSILCFAVSVSLAAAPPENVREFGRTARDRKVGSSSR